MIQKALKHENERLLNTVKVQAAAIKIMREMKAEPYFEHYQAALGKMVVTTGVVVTPYDSIPKSFGPVEFTDNLTISQARAVYIYLQGVFS